MHRSIPGLARLPLTLLLLTSALAAALVGPPLETGTAFASVHFTISVKASPASVSPGSVVYLATSATSSVVASAQAQVNVLGPNGVVAYKRTFNPATYRVGQTRQFSTSWRVPTSAMAGTYSIGVVMLASDGTELARVGAAATFTVPSAHLVATTTPVPSPTAGSTVVPSPTPTVLPTPSSPAHLYGIVGQGGLGESLDTTLLSQQYNAGVRGRLLELGWNILQPNGPTDWNAPVAAVFQQRIDAFVATGPDTQLYLDLGLTYPPDWVTTVDPLTDQFGNKWSGSASIGGGVNIYFSPTVRQYVASYIQKVFANLNFHGRLNIVRVGFYNAELDFPSMGSASGTPVSFWAFDATAQARSPVPGWKPGQASPNNEARQFYLWYVDRLTDSFNFVLGEIRKQYGGNVAPVTPGSGMWNQLVDTLVADNLYVPGWANVGTANYWQRIYSMLPPASANVVNWVSSVGDSSGVNEASSTPWDWSSTHQHAYLAQLNGRRIYAENTGNNAFDTSQGADPRSTMQWTFAGVQAYQLNGLMWVRQATMSSPSYASLPQYASEIAQHP